MPWVAVVLAVLVALAVLLVVAQVVDQVLDLVSSMKALEVVPKVASVVVVVDCSQKSNQQAEFGRLFAMTPCDDYHRWSNVRGDPVAMDRLLAKGHIVPEGCLLPKDLMVDLVLPLVGLSVLCVHL